MRPRLAEHLLLHDYHNMLYLARERDGNNQTQRCEHRILYHPTRQCSYRAVVLILHLPHLLVARFLLPRLKRTHIDVWDPATDMVTHVAKILAALA